MNFYIGFMIVSTLLTLVLLIYSIMNHIYGRADFLILSAICVFLYSIGYLFEMASPDYEAAFIGVRIQKMGSLFLAVFNLLFIRDICGRKRLKPWLYIVLFIIPITNFISAQAYPALKWHYINARYFHNGSIANIAGEPGIVNYIAIIYSFIIFGFSLYYMIKKLIVARGSQRHQSVVILASLVIPILVNLYHTFSYGQSTRLDLNPFAVSIAMLLLLYAVHMQNLLNVVPIAREKVIESMAEAFIVFGKDHQYLDANQAAKQIFPNLKDLTPGEVMKEATMFENKEVSIMVNNVSRFYRISKTPILQNTKQAGTFMVFHDITDKEAELKKLYGRATYDPLMHIYNRATFFELANFLLETERALETSFALLMIDLDSFKQINDTYGHLCGDVVLEAIAFITKNHFHKTDIIGRYGGEEIVVLLENISINQLFLVVNNLRHTIEKTMIPYQDYSLNITVSIGMAHSLAGSSHSLKEMLIQADTALYQAKNGGKNRIWLYGE